MQYLKCGFLSLLFVVCLSLAGCGGSSTGSGTVSDPMAASTSGSGTGAGTGTTPITTQDPTFNLVLTTDLVKPTDLTRLPQIDANIGTVLLTAQCVSVQGGVLIDPNAPGGDFKIEAGAPVQNQKIEYKIIAGPGTITYPAYPGSTPGTGIVTDSNGKAEAVYTSGNVLSTTNVIIEASTTIGVQTYRAYTQFQIVRGTGVIMFTDTSGKVQSSMLDSFEKVVNPAITPAVSVLQLIPFKVTDSNGNPRVGVPVTLYVYSITTKNPNDVTIDYLVPTTIEGSILGPNPEPNQQTITTDSAGMGIFNVSTNIVSPPPGSFTTVTVVFKAVTNDAIPVTAFIGRLYSLTSSLPTLTIAPSAASFGTGTDISFTIGGGIKPYAVSSNNTGRVTATLQADGTTVLAHLVDTTAWTGAVTISVIDSAGQTASATVSR